MRLEPRSRTGVPFLTSGTILLMVFMGVGLAFGLGRIFNGLGAVTNLDNQHPWGIWIAIDVACGVALAAGGFTAAALIEIFWQHSFKRLLRPAILTAWLGYLFVAVALIFDLGRWWNIWRPVFFWQGNSVLFEVGICVVAYLLVLTIEMAPAVLGGVRDYLEEHSRDVTWLERLKEPVRVARAFVRAVLPIFIVAGVVLSCMHQSSLGTLMVIAPTKLDPIWYSSFLPVLFLLSAIMVGFPMLIVESILAHKSLGLEPEMDVLERLATKVPILIGIYALAKAADLLSRLGTISFVSNPGTTIAFAVEVVIGLIVPFVILLWKPVRRSPGWLLTASLMVVFGVVMNRINVFLVGYRPAYETHRYFPSIGEIALTLFVVCTIVFLYRLFVTFFPVLWVERVGAAEPPASLVGPPVPISRRLGFVFRSVGVLFLLGFVALYSFVHGEALHASAQTVQEIHRLKMTQAEAAALPGPAYPQRPLAYKNFYLLESPILNEKTDDYEPVGFAHRIHDALTGGDCGVCHHRYAMSADDRIGEDIKALHAAIDVRLGGPCASCHENMASNPPQSCSRCHGLPNEADAPSRIGLKGAYHRQCIGCHEKQTRMANAPADCKACHHPWTPDHSTLVALGERPAPQQVTQTCLTCHADVGEDIMGTAHWSWKGRSPTLVGSEHRVDVSLTSVVGNYFLGIGTEPGRCAACHIGYGWADAGFDLNDADNIDCLVCHDTTGLYRKDPGTAGMPDPTVDLAVVARAVGRPSRQTCGGCHFSSGGFPNAKHGDLEPALADPPAELDVHMGALAMRCQDCHTTVAHRISGRSLLVPAVEGTVECERCHGASPHGMTGVLSRHLDDHVKSVACETCHIPSLARTAPTLLAQDFSTAGQDRSVERGPGSMQTYDPRFGTLVWGMDVTPVYLWYDGSHTLSLAGDRIDPTKAVVLSAPVGERRNPRARIFPFKRHTAVQPFDEENRTLVVAELWDRSSSGLDWQAAIRTGMERMGLPYSGRHAFVQTVSYSSVHHEVVPDHRALSCGDCHSVEAVQCRRCHRAARGTTLPDEALARFPEVRHRMDFDALGYEDDPATVGGRFYVTLGRGVPPQ